MRAYLIALAAAVLLVAFDILTAPALFLQADGAKMILAWRVRDGMSLPMHEGAEKYFNEK